jgi:hypothetical protein
MITSFYYIPATSEQRAKDISEAIWRLTDPNERDATTAYYTSWHEDSVGNWWLLMPSGDNELGNIFVDNVASPERIVEILEPFRMVGVISQDEINTLVTVIEQSRGGTLLRIWDFIPQFWKDRKIKELQ